MGSVLSKHTGLITRTKKQKGDHGVRKTAVRQSGKTHKGLAGVGHHVSVHVQTGTLCTQSRGFDVHLVASCATVGICADVTGC